MTNTDEGPHRMFNITEADIAQAQKDKERMRSMTDKGLIEVSKLKPCPFCGGKAVYCSAEGDLYIQHFIACEKCGCEGKPSTGKRHAIQLWNTRQPERESIAAESTANQPSGDVEKALREAAITADNFIKWGDGNVPVVRLDVVLALLPKQQPSGDDVVSSKLAHECGFNAGVAATEARWAEKIFDEEQALAAMSLGEGADWKEPSPATQPSGDVVFSALKRLVDLKAHKDKCGKTLYYEEQQPQAWEQAIAAMSLGEGAVWKEPSPANQPSGDDVERVARAINIAAWGDDDYDDSPDKDYLHNVAKAAIAVMGDIQLKTEQSEFSQSSGDATSPTTNRDEPVKLSERQKIDELLMAFRVYGRHTIECEAEFAKQFPRPQCCCGYDDVLEKLIALQHSPATTQQVRRGMNSKRKTIPDLKG